MQPRWFPVACLFGIGVAWSWAYYSAFDRSGMFDDVVCVDVFDVHMDVTRRGLPNPNLSRFFLEPASVKI